MAKKITPPYIPSVVSLPDISHIANIGSLLWGKCSDCLLYHVVFSDSYDDKW